MAEWAMVLVSVVIALFTGLTWLVYRQIAELMRRTDLDRFLPIVYVKFGGTSGAGEGRMGTSVGVINRGSGPARCLRVTFYHPSLDSPQELVRGEVQLPPKDWDGPARASITLTTIVYPVDQDLMSTPGAAVVARYQDLFGRKFESRNERGRFEFLRLPP